MSLVCSAKQVAEAVMIWSAHKFSTHVLCTEYEDTKDLKCLDLFLSTLDVFRDAFSTAIMNSFISHYEEIFHSKQSLVDYLKPRVAFLTKNNGYFDLMLLCAYFSRLINIRAFSHSCFHFSRVACKLLVAVLDHRFHEVFATVYGWDSLMCYCRHVHAIMFPSKRNRPPDYESYLKDSSQDDKPDPFGVEWRKERNKSLYAELQYFRKRNEIDESVSLGREASRCVENITTYWKYFQIGSHTISERLTDNRGHLEDVLYLLEWMGLEPKPYCIFDHEYNFQVSDDEQDEKLERDHDWSRYENLEINISQEVKECFAIDICERENAQPGRTQLRPEDITLEEVRAHIESMFLEEEGDEEEEDKCQLCDNKMYTFIQNWKRSFREKYFNSKMVTDVIF